MTVLALLDGTSTDGLVAKQAAKLTARSRGRLVLLRSMPLVERSEPRPGGGAPAIQPWERMRSQKATARRELSELSHDLGVPAEVRVGFGDKAEAVAEVAAGRGVDLVVAAIPRRRRLPWLKRDFSLLAAGRKKRFAAATPYTVATNATAIPCPTSSMFSRCFITWMSPSTAPIIPTVGE